MGTFSIQRKNVEILAATAKSGGGVDHVRQIVSGRSCRLGSHLGSQPCIHGVFSPMVRRIVLLFAAPLLKIGDDIPKLPAYHLQFFDIRN